MSLLLLLPLLRTNHNPSSFPLRFLPPALLLRFLRWRALILVESFRQQSRRRRSCWQRKIACTRSQWRRESATYRFQYLHRCLFQLCLLLCLYPCILLHLHFISSPLRQALENAQREATVAAEQEMSQLSAQLSELRSALRSCTERWETTLYRSCVCSCC